MQALSIESQNYNLKYPKNNSKETKYNAILPLKTFFKKNKP